MPLGKPKRTRTTSRAAQRDVEIARRAATKRRAPGIMPTPTLCDAMLSTLTGAPLSAHTVM